jgi:hypothetical protein
MFRLRSNHHNGVRGFIQMRVQGGGEPGRVYMVIRGNHLRLVSLASNRSRRSEEGLNSTLTILGSILHLVPPVVDVGTTAARIQSSASHQSLPLDELSIQVFQIPSIMVCQVFSNDHHPRTCRSRCPCRSMTLSRSWIMVLGERAWKAMRRVFISELQLDSSTL